MRFWGYRERPVEVVHEAGLTEADVEKAYEKGRRDERARHRSHPILGLAVAVVALVGGAMLVLAAREGSFADGGRVMDAQIASASDRVQTASLGHDNRQDAAPPDQTTLPKADAGR